MTLYTLSTYPPELPNLGVGTTEEVENNVIAGTSEMGLPSQKYIRSNPVKILKISLGLKPHEYRLFKSWWRDTLRWGMLPFEGEFSAHGVTGIRKMQFISQPQYASLRGGDWKLSISAWCWESPGMSKEEVIQTVVDVIYLEGLTSTLRGILESYYDLGNQP